MGLGCVPDTDVYRCLGNHEFDSGVGGLTPFIKHVTCPVLAANLDLTNVPELAKQTNLRNSVVFNISGVEIGVIGYLTPETKTLAVKNDVEYMDEIKALEIEVNKLRKQGINIIIALGHSGYERDKVIAKEVDGIDLIIGGHSHSFLYNGSEPDTEASEGNYPTYVTQASGKQIPIVQAYAFTKYMGQLHLVFNSNGDLITLHGMPKLLDETVPEDPSMLELLNHYRGEVENIAHQVIGNTSVILDGRTCEQQECNLGNLITDSMVYYYAIQHHGEYWTDASIGILQAGGIRSSIAHDVLPAQVTKEDLLTVLPFKGSLVVVTMNGTILKQMLEHSVARYEQGKMGEFLQVSGLKILYDLNNISGHRVVEVQARCADCDIPKLQNLENRQLYKVIMTDFIANGGDGFKMLKYQGAKILPYNELAATQHYIAHNHFIFPSIEGRITFHKKFVETNSSNKLSALSATSIIIYLFIN